MIKKTENDIGTIQQMFLEELHFLFLEVPNSIESQKKAWPKFEARFPTLTGRKMYGLDYDDQKRYRLCSLIDESDKGETFGLEQFIFEGGKYVRLRLKASPDELFKKIDPAYKYMISVYKNEIDWSRPLIEHYKSKCILDILLPLL